MNDSWRLVKPWERSDATITFSRVKRGDGRVYFSKKLSEAIYLKEKKYCYVYEKNGKLLFTFADEPLFDGYRRVQKNHIKIAGRYFLGKFLEKGKKITIIPKIQDGNILVDMKWLK